MRRIIISAIKTYRFLISPLMANHCRFHPSCSSYAIEAIEKHGAVKGLWLAVRRLSKCHPFHEGGIDPVPNKHPESLRHTTH